jgi:hypothetical protein
MSDTFTLRPVTDVSSIDANKTYKEVEGHLFEVVETVPIVQREANKNTGLDTVEFKFHKENYGSMEEDEFKQTVTNLSSRTKTTVSDAKKALVGLMFEENLTYDDREDLRDTLSKYMRHKDKHIRKNMTDVLEQIETKEAIDAGLTKKNGKLNK